MYSCHSIPECYNLFSGVKLSIKSFVLLPILAILRLMRTRLNLIRVDKGDRSISINLFI